jgi:hypothetical protein
MQLHRVASRDGTSRATLRHPKPRRARFGRGRSRPRRDCLLRTVVRPARDLLSCAIPLSPGLVSRTPLPAKRVRDAKPARCESRGVFYELHDHGRLPLARCDAGALAATDGPRRLLRLVPIRQRRGHTAPVAAPPTRATARVRLQAAANRAASKHIGDTRNRGKAGPRTSRSRRRGRPARRPVAQVAASTCRARLVHVICSDASARTASLSDRVPNEACHGTGDRAGLFGTRSDAKSGTATRCCPAPARRSAYGTVMGPSSRAACPRPEAFGVVG